MNGTKKELLESEGLKNNVQIESMNKLLIEMVKNQKENINHLVKVFIITIVCYTVLLLGMVVVFYMYESQFEVEETETIRYEQETSSDDGGDAVGIINNNGDWSYGDSKTSGNDN